jgi:hypothetical protein
MRGRVLLPFGPPPSPFAGFAGANEVDLAIAYRDFLASVAGGEGMSRLAVGFTRAFLLVAELGGGTHEGKIPLLRPSNRGEDTENRRKPAVVT